MVEHRDAGVPLSKNLPAAAPAEEQLPEWEELTPEFLKDECVRGDFMIRWTVILLAVLLGWMNITETGVLVSIRTGEAIAANGGVPLRSDPFSATAAGRPWTNLHWLSDLLLAGVHAIGGFPALTILSALCAGGAFWSLSQINQGKDSTWWPSYCYGLALVAAMPMFQPGETGITILGMSLLLWGLHQWTVQPGGRLTWLLPLLFVLWGNMDSRAWLGLAVLAAFSVGTLLSWDARLRGASVRTGMMAAGCLAGGLAASPWPLAQLWSQGAREKLLSAYRDYGTLAEFFPSLSARLPVPGQSANLDIYVYLCWLLMGLACLALILNVRKTEACWALVWLVAAWFSRLSGELACAGAVVSAVVAALNGQAWYRRNLSMEYRIDNWSVLSGRAGRAVTVLALFFVAWSAINGALLGPQRRRIGLGLDPRWKNRIASLQADVVPREYGQGVFPILPVQGDLLIWLGRKPFIDSRLSLYLDGGENLKQLHLDARASILAPPRAADEGIDPQAWKKTLERYNVRNVQIRLWGDQPGYSILVRMLVQPDWTLTALGAAAANFVRNDLPDEQLRAFLEKSRADQFVKQAFQPAEPPTVAAISGAWAYPQSTYNDWLIQKLRTVPAPANLALHYTEIMRELNAALTPEQIAALSLLSIRQAREALMENPNDSLSYRVLAHSQRMLQEVEGIVTVLSGSPQLPRWRVGQQRAALFSDVTGAPRDPRALVPLIVFLFDQREIDLGLNCLSQYEALAGPMDPKVRAANNLEDVYSKRAELAAHVQNFRQEIERARRAQTEPANLVREAITRGCPGIALELMEADQTLIQDPSAQLIYATLLQTCGQTDKAYEAIDGLLAKMQSTRLPPEAAAFEQQAKAVAAEIHLAAGDAPRTIALWEPAPWLDVELRGMKALLEQPFATPLPERFVDLWPATTGRLAYSALAESTNRWAYDQLRIALVEIQIGQLKEGTVRLRDLLRQYPRFEYRGLAVFYLRLLTGEAISSFVPPPEDLPLDVSLLLPFGPPSPSLPAPLQE